MYRGRYQQGSIFYLRVITRDANGTPAYPLEQVRWKLINPAGQIVYNDTAPAIDTDIKGSFGVPLVLTSFFTTPGRYTLFVQAKMSSTLYRSFVLCFRVIAGGISGGGVHSQYYWNRPEGAYIVGSNENGEIFSGRNPALS